LVSDEHPVEGRWGQLFRFNFSTGESWVEHSFGGDSVPTSIGFDRKTGEMVFASKRIYRMSPTGPRLLGFEVANIHALAFAPAGEMCMAEYDGGPVVQVDLPARKIVKTYQGFPTIWSMAVTGDGKNVRVGSGSGDNAALQKVPVSCEPSTAVWKPRSSEGVGVFVTALESYPTGENRVRRTVASEISSYHPARGPAPRSIVHDLIIDLSTLRNVGTVLGHFVTAPTGLVRSRAAGVIDGNGGIRYRPVRY
jgi:hypothetical protein